MNYCLLADRPEFIDTIVDWYYRQWGQNSDVYTVDFLATKVAASVNRNSLPQIILALEQEQLVAVAELKLSEMAEFPEYEFWLGGVYVCSADRGTGVASALVQQAIAQAQRLGITTLYLQTEELSGGLYQKLGFSPAHQLMSNQVEVIVMRLPIKLLEPQQV